MIATLPFPLDWICIGDNDCAKNMTLLQQNNIRYILNCTSKKTDGGLPNYHEKCNRYEYCRLPMQDNATETLSLHYDAAWKFFERARIREDGKLLLHCNMGVSRSVSIAISYLLKYHRHTYLTALSLISSERIQAKPNDSFIKQLQELDASLRKSNGYINLTPTKRKLKEKTAIGVQLPPWLVKESSSSGIYW
eukprot:Platyproteum_vivax@DN5161_c0_g1_i2.p1